MSTARRRLKSPRSLSGTSAHPTMFTQGNIMVMTSTFLLMDATAVTLGQGHGKVIQYISPDPCILCAIKGLAQTVLTWEGKVFAAADAAETDWKHKVTPERGDLMTEAKLKPEFVLTKDTPYLALTGELWSVYWEDLGENWLHYNGTPYIKGQWNHSDTRFFCYQSDDSW